MAKLTASHLRLAWVTGNTLPVNVWHLSPTFAPQTGHSKSVAFIQLVYDDGLPSANRDGGVGLCRPLLRNGAAGHHVAAGRKATALAIAANVGASNNSRIRQFFTNRVVAVTVIQFNETVANAEATAEFLTEIGLGDINLLPFHRLGTSKYEQLGLNYEYAEQASVGQEALGALAAVHREKAITCYRALTRHFSYPPPQFLG